MFILVHTNTLAIMYMMYVTISSQSGQSPLHAASASGRTTNVTLLLDHGADIHAKDRVCIISTIMCKLTCIVSIDA